MSVPYLSELTEKYKNRLTFSLDSAKLKNAPPLWKKVIGVDAVRTDALYQLWAGLYEVMPDSVEEFFAALKGVCVTERPKGQVSLGYILRYKSGNLTVFEGHSPCQPDEDLSILPDTLAQFYRHTHNGFSSSPNMPSLFLPKHQWLTINRQKYDISDAEAQAMGIEIEKVINFYEINSLLYVGWYPVNRSYVLLDIKYREATQNIDVIEEIAPYFFHAEEYE